MKAIDPGDRRIANIQTAPFRTLFSDGMADGEVLQLDTNRRLGTGFHLYRMAPGTTTQAHSHIGHEEFLRLECDLVDHDGTRYGPGDLVWLRDGASHASYTESNWLIVVFATDFGPPDNQ
jgi:anti-sigma factor ChrR (cupin superfamily)